MSDYRYDPHFDLFLKDFGEPFDVQPIPEAVVEAYRHKLPQQLLTYWQKLGACGFGQGLCWMTNPAEYQDLLDSWLAESVFEERDDLSVIARTAFGKLYVWSQTHGPIMRIAPHTGRVYLNRKCLNNPFPPEKADHKMRQFWAYKNPELLDMEDGQDKPLFERAFKKLGRLKADEMYGYIHRPSLGGADSIKNIEITKLHVYHDLSQELEGREFVKLG